MRENIPTGPVLWTLFLSCPVLFERVLNNENIRSTAGEGRTFLASGSEPGRILNLLHARR